MLHSARRRRLVPRKVETLKSRRNWLAEFVAYLSGERRRSVNTIDAYRRDMVRFFEWLGNRDPVGLTVRELRDYIGWLYQLQLAPATRARHIASLREFLRFLQIEGILDDNAAKLLATPSQWRRLKDILTPEQVAELLIAPHPDEDKLWRRDRAILEFFYATGFRVSELSNLRLRDIRLAEGECSCVGKGNKPRTVPLGRPAIETFRIWMTEERPDVQRRVGVTVDTEFFHFVDETKKTPDRLLPWAFLSWRGQKIQRQAMWELIKKYAMRIGAPSTISPHSLRHSFATHFLANGADLVQVQEMLGHKSVATTQVYLHNDAERLKAIHKKFHPRG